MNTLFMLVVEQCFFPATLGCSVCPTLFAATKQQLQLCLQASSCSMDIAPGELRAAQCRFSAPKQNRSSSEQELELAWRCKSTSTFGHRGTLGTDKGPMGAVRAGPYLCSRTAAHGPLCLENKVLINFISAAALCMQELKVPVRSQGG